METPNFELEHALAGDGFDLVVGFDEVGRGSLAGPVMVGAAAFLAGSLKGAERNVPAGLNDSKLLTEHRREAMFDALAAWCDGYAIGSASNEEIDEWGISHALGIAALRALEQVERQLGERLRGPGVGGGDVRQGGADGGTTVGAGRKGGVVRLGPSKEQNPAAAEGTGRGTGTRRGNAPSRRLHADSVAIQPEFGLAVDGIPGESTGNVDDAGPSVHTGADAWAGIRVGAILDGPHDYITKALGTFEAPDVPVPAHVVTKVKGDRACSSVACAAVLAKVTRDRLMEKLGERPEYAVYGWQRNKGYGSKEHRDAIASHGPSDLHRISWKLT
ncbi:ribonuclease HII [Bifidobacterium cuniculi]|uniref:Ribonuclease n=1 Tax=Bifidobacterium cuniculi TaxID=1688 RepID=A0A087AWR2_9BIFI|nr:ribonuclease HII [Bifidobacterium cuniculi]KFI63212.1 ribonuclease HII [Bifidobacterium cuniculi]